MIEKYIINFVTRVINRRGNSLSHRQVLGHHKKQYLGMKMFRVKMNPNNKLTEKQAHS